MQFIIRGSIANISSSLNMRKLKVTTTQKRFHSKIDLSLMYESEWQRFVMTRFTEPLKEDRRSKQLNL